MSTEGVEPGGHPDPILPRVGRGLLLGLGAGLYAGLLIGFGEALYLLFRGKVVEEAQVFWAAPLAYGGLLGLAGAGGGAGIGLLPVPRSVFERWVPPLGFVACLVPYGLVMTLFFLYRDVYAEHVPPLPVLGAVAGGALLVAAVALGGFWLFTGTRLRFFHILDRKHFRSADRVETNNPCSFHSLLLPCALCPHIPGFVAEQFQIIRQHDAVG